MREHICSWTREVGITPLEGRQAVRMRRRGFTLLELIIVTMIIGILSVVAAPRFAETLSIYRVETAAKQLRSDLEKARVHAKTTSASQTVEFDAAGNSYTLPGVPDIDHPSRDYQILVESRFRAWIVSADCGGDAVLSFNGYGAPDSGAEIVLQAGNHQMTVLVDADTGSARVQ